MTENKASQKTEKAADGSTDKKPETSTDKKAETKADKKTESKDAKDAAGNGGGVANPEGQKRTTRSYKAGWKRIWGNKAK